MPGTIIAVNVEIATVEKGPHPAHHRSRRGWSTKIKAPHGGIVRQMHLSVGDYVQQGVLLLENSAGRLAPRTHTLWEERISMTRFTKVFILFVLALGIIAVFRRQRSGRKRCARAHERACHP